MIDSVREPFRVPHASGACRFARAPCRAGHVPAAWSAHTLGSTRSTGGDNGAAIGHRARGRSSGVRSVARQPPFRAGWGSSLRSRRRSWRRSAASALAALCSNRQPALGGGNPHRTPIGSPGDGCRFKGWGAGGRGRWPLGAWLDSASPVSLRALTGEWRTGGGTGQELRRPSAARRAPRSRRPSARRSARSAGRCR